MERERPLAGARGDAEGLIGEEEGSGRALPPAEIELASERDAVEQMADVEEERRQHDARPAAPVANSPTAVNWALPAKTSAESACVSTRERPAPRAVTA